MARGWILPAVIKNLLRPNEEEREKKVLKDILLEGLDKRTKEAIINYLREKQLCVTGVEADTYTVDITQLDLEKNREFFDFLESYRSDDFVLSESKDSAEPVNSEITSIFSQLREQDMDDAFALKKDGMSDNNDDSDEDVNSRPQYVRTMHPPEHLEFSLTNPHFLPVTSYTKEEIHPPLSKTIWRAVRRFFTRTCDRFQLAFCSCTLPCTTKLFCCICHIFTFISEKRYNRRMKKMKKEGFQVYSVGLDNKTPLRQDKNLQTVCRSMNTFTYEGILTPIRDRATMTDSNETRDLAVNTILYTNMPHNVYNMSIVSPDVLSLSNFAEEQKGHEDKGVNASVTMSNIAVTADLQLRTMPPDLAAGDAPSGFYRSLEVDSIPEVSWACPCEAFAGLFKGLTNYINFADIPQASTSGALSEEIKRHRSEIMEVKRMLHSTMDLLNKKHSNRIVV